MRQRDVSDIQYDDPTERRYGPAGLRRRRERDTVDEGAGVFQ